MERGPQPQAAVRHPGDRAPQTASAQSGQNGGRSAHSAGQSTGTPEGNRRGQHSIRINDQWRICFMWQEGRASDVEIIDYHD
jgi:hypothetical protein